MPVQMWTKTERGRARKIYDKFIYRWKEKGYVVNITAQEFYSIFLGQSRCCICGGQFQNVEDSRRKLHRSVRVKNSIAVRENKIIEPEHLFICHFSCGCKRNTQILLK